MERNNFKTFEEFINFGDEILQNELKDKEKGKEFARLRVQEFILQNFYSCKDLIKEVEYPIYQIGDIKIKYSYRKSPEREYSFFEILDTGDEVKQENMLAFILAKINHKNKGK